MADNVKPRVRVPRSGTAGEAFEIKTLISHKMESGQRKDSDGNTIPRSIIHHFSCDFNGENVMQTNLHGAISTNPYIQFHAVVQESGTFTFTWDDDDGSVYTETKDIEIS